MSSVCCQIDRLAAKQARCYAGAVAWSVATSWRCAWVPCRSTEARASLCASWW